MNCLIKIRINKKHKEFLYSCNQDSTFENLLEYISYLYKNICPCFQFIIKKKFDDVQIISKNEIINNYIQYNNSSYNKSYNYILENINLINREEKCLCDSFIKEKYQNTKLEIINSLKNLNDENYKLYRALNFVCKGNQEIINNLKELGSPYNYNQFQFNQLKIDPKTGNFIGSKTLNDEIDPIKFYDVIINIKSIKDIIKGWEIKFSERMTNKYKEFLKNNTLKIGIIGNSNKGKSFLLSKISKINLPSGTSIRTEGLSVKYPDQLNIYKDRKIVLLDSAGLETTVLKKGEEDIEEEEGEEENEEKEENDFNRGETKKENKSKNQSKSKENYFEKRSREKLITELFLQNYIICNSDVLIIVVGILTYSEQILLNKIKNEMKRAKINKTLYIIHNLMTYTSVKQVEDYINFFLLRSATFTLEKQENINTKLNSGTGLCYYEKNIDDNQKIFHLIYANENSDAGEYYNNFTLNFIEDSYKTITNIKPFDVIDTVRKQFKNVSLEYFEKLEGEVIFDKSITDKIKIKKPEKLVLKRCLINELGISNLKANGFEPTYNYYIKDNKIILRVEAPGNCDISSLLDYTGEFTYISIEGEKRKDKEPEKLEDNLINKREIGKFSFKIPIEAKKYIIKNKPPDIKKLNGIFILSFDLEEAIKTGQYKQSKDEEV